MFDDLDYDELIKVLTPTEEDLKEKQDIILNGKEDVLDITFQIIVMTVGMILTNMV